MLKVKATVKPKSLVIAAACANVAEELKLTITITSGSDGKHMKGSKHYVNEALDIRSKNLSPTTKAIFLQKMLERLGKDYEGFVEDAHTDNEHFHFERDPK